MGGIATDTTSRDMTVLLDSLPYGVLLFDARGLTPILLHANAELVRMTGYTMEQLRSQPLWQLFAGPQSEPLAQQQVRSAFSGTRVAGIEWLIYSNNRGPFWARLSCSGKQRNGMFLVTIEDISAYKSTRESLRTSEARLDVAIEAGGLAMWDWNIVLDEIYYNDGWRQSLEIDPEELLTRQALHERLLLPGDRPEVLQQFEDHYHGCSAHFASEYSLVIARGARRWFQAYAKVVQRDAEGRPLRMIGVLTDVTSRHRTVQDMRAVQERWERAVRGTSDGLYDWDLLTGHVWYAARFREIVGRDEAEFPDTFASFQNALHPDDRTLVLAKIRAHLENRAKLDLRCRILTRTGETLWCRLRGEAVRDPAGRPLRLSGSISDITAQIAAEEALTRSQDFYGTILDSLPLFIAYVDRDQRIVYANRNFQDLFAVPLASSRGRVINDVIGDRRYSAIAHNVSEALAGKPSEAQGKFRAASGRVLDLEALFLPHHDEYGQGELQGCIIVARDMTDKRQLEAVLHQSQKMEAVGRLTGGIAHDFNNLLSVIIGNLQLLARSLRENPRQLRQTETALSAAMRGAALTRRLLAFARQQVLEPRIVDLNTMIGGMCELLRRTLASDIEIKLELASQLWPIRVDPSQLESAVLNLVINARDALPNGGTITIRTRNSVVEADRVRGSEPLASGEYALLEIQDTGVGMPPQVLKRVFEPFFTTKDVGKGTGLGLSMVYGFVKQSGGHVHITSAPNQGTTVHLYFPRVHASVAAAADAKDPGDPPTGSELLLVVEDNAEVRRTAVDILSSLGYRVLEAADAQEALVLFERHEDIALVFSDVMLPGGMLGSQLVLKLREHRPDLRILMTSGFSESGNMRRGVLDGSIELLHKPYTVEDLARRVRALLDAKKEPHCVSP